MALLFETTDAPASTATPYKLHAGDEFHGKLSVATGDWLAVTLTAGTTYTFGAVGIGTVNTGVTDTRLVLHGPAGAILGTDDNGGPGETSSLTFTAVTSATYFIEVQSKAGPVEADYGLAMTYGDRVSYGVTLGAAEIYREGLSWAATPAAATTVTWGFRASGTAYDANGNHSTFYQLSAAQQNAAERALDAYSSIANITFQQVNPDGFTNNATILIGAYQSENDGSGAYAYYPGSRGARSDDGDLWINNKWISKTDLPIGSYAAAVFLHELGHAMGLAHPGDYNAAPGVDVTYQNNAQFAEDSNQFTVMSYFDATDSAAAAPTHSSDTLMMYDIYAVQQLYGINTSTNAGRSVYGFHSTVGGAFDFSVNTAPLLSIWDGNGIDVLDLSGFAQAQTIDLNDGHFSDVGGYKGNVSIAVGCRIENAIAGTGADVVIGNGAANRLQGRAGDDTLIGGAGNDTLTGNPGANTFVFSTGSGKDVITDFNKAMDELSLTAALWGSAVFSSAEVVLHYGKIVDGHVVLDFGAETIALLNQHALSGLAAQILIS